MLAAVVWLASQLLRNAEFARVLAASIASARDLATTRARPTVDARMRALTTERDARANSRRHGAGDDGARARTNARERDAAARRALDRDRGDDGGDGDARGDDGAGERLPSERRGAGDAVRTRGRARDEKKGEPRGDGTRADDGGGR